MPGVPDLYRITVFVDHTWPRDIVYGIIIGRLSTILNGVCIDRLKHFERVLHNISGFYITAFSCKLYYLCVLYL